MAKRTAEEAELTHQRLLTAALEVFCEKGVARTTLDDVARQTGMTRGAVYWHFTDKESLLRETLNRQLLPVEMLVANRDLRRNCQRLIEAVVRTTCSSPHSHVVKILIQRSEWDYAGGVVRKRILLARTRFIGFLEQMLLHAQQSGQLSGACAGSDTTSLVPTLCCSVTGVVYESLMLAGVRRSHHVKTTLASLLNPILFGIHECPPDRLCCTSHPTGTRRLTV